MPPRKEPGPVPASARVEEPEPWVRLELLVPAPWKRWLEESSEARAMSVAALVRQCIRELMIRTRPERESTTPAASVST